MSQHSQESNAHPISTLPAELLVRVTEHLDVNDCRSLSSVNSQFRRFLIPTLFKGLKATNRFEDVEIIQHLVSNYGRHVHRLNFDLHLEPNNQKKDESSDERFDIRYNADAWYSRCNVEATPSMVWEILSRRALPNVSTMKLTFHPFEEYEGQGWDDDGLGSGMYMCDDVEDDERVINAEERFSWRALWTHAFKTIAEGSVPLRKLEIRRLPPKTASIYWTDEWKAFLNGLEEFELNPWGGDNGAGWHANTLQGYLDSITDLNGSYFSHLRAAKRVRLEADYGNPIGCDGWRQCPIPIGTSDLPNVTQLELENCFVDHDLMAWLEKHPRQLKSFHLINCFSAGIGIETGTANVALSWSEFFSALRRTQPNIADFVYTNERIPLTHDEQFHREDDYEGGVISFVPGDDEPEDVKAVREGLRSDEKRRLFDYHRLDDKYGMVFAYEEVTIQSFLEGDDQREYDLLMEVLGKNEKA